MERHKAAERSKFIRRLLNRKITPEQYYVYLSNQLFCYYALEFAAARHGLLNGIDNIKRSSKISKDLSELENEYNLSVVPPLLSTRSYMDYINSISNEPDKLMAHVYVRHMGDLSGGQVIKNLVPGQGMYYQFDGDITVLKEKIREKLHDGMADEANRCFDMISVIFEELEGQFDNVVPSTVAQ